MIFIGIPLFIIVILGITYYTITLLGHFFQRKTKRSYIVLSILVYILCIVGSKYLSTQWYESVDLIWSILIGWGYVIFFLSPLVGLLSLIHHRYPLPRSLIVLCILWWLWWWVYFGNTTLHTNLVIPHTGLDKPIKIVFISDIHANSINSTQYIKRIVAEIQSEHPDLVLIGWDIFDNANTSYIKPLEAFNTLSMPIYAILGNHDHMWDRQAVETLFQITQLQPLINTSILFSGLQIVGIDDKSSRQGQTLQQVLHQSQISSGAQYTILLTHQPQKLDKLTDYPINLELAGHTHRGQFIPLSWLISLFNDYSYGRYYEDGRIAFVSQGIGGWWALLRMGTQSEMVVITLQP